MYHSLLTRVYLRIFFIIASNSHRYRTCNGECNKSCHRIIPQSNPNAHANLSPGSSEHTKRSNILRGTDVQALMLKDGTGKGFGTFLKGIKP